MKINLPCNYRADDGKIYTLFGIDSEGNYFGATSFKTFNSETLVSEDSIKLVEIIRAANT